jgi:hypothetical protein
MEEKPPIVESSTSSSTLGKMIRRSTVQAAAKVSSLVFEQNEMVALVAKYEGRDGVLPNEIEVYQRRLREINTCLRCFSTEWRVPGGQNDPVMNLIFTKYHLLLRSNM